METIEYIPSHNNLKIKCDSTEGTPEKNVILFCIDSIILFYFQDFVS